MNLLARILRHAMKSGIRSSCLKSFTFISLGEQGRHGRLFDCGEVQFGQPCSILAAGHRSLCNLLLPAASSANHRIEAVTNTEAEAEAEAEAVTEAGAFEDREVFPEHSYLNTLKSKMFGAY